MNDPATVPRAQLRAAYDALGLDPDGWNQTISIEINPDGVIVVRQWLDEQGRCKKFGDGIATEAIMISVGAP